VAKGCNCGCGKDYETVIREIMSTPAALNREQAEAALSQANLARMVTVELFLDPEDYKAISSKASWDGKSVEAWLIDLAMGRGRVGC
jgi:hypothetical protein